MQKNVMMLLVLGFVATLPATAMAVDWLGVVSDEWDYQSVSGNWDGDPDPPTGGVYYKTTVTRVEGFGAWGDHDPIYQPTIADGNNTVWGWAKFRNGAFVTQTGGYHEWANGSSSVAFSLMNENWWNDGAATGGDASAIATLQMTGGMQVVRGRTSIGYDGYGAEGAGILNIWGDGIFQVVTGNLLEYVPHFPGTHLLIDTDSVIDIRDNGELRVPLDLQSAVDAYIAGSGNFDYIEITDWGNQYWDLKNLVVTSPLIVSGDADRPLYARVVGDEYVVSLAANEPIPGDFNRDDIVDVSDLGILATNYGTMSGMTWGDGDATGDEAVDVSDLGILATHYGASSGMTWWEGDANGGGAANVADLGLLATYYGTAYPAVASVPEPGSITLLLCGLASLALLRRW